MNWKVIYEPGPKCEHTLPDEKDFKYGSIIQCNMCNEYFIKTIRWIKFNEDDIIFGHDIDHWIRHGKYLKELNNKFLKK